MQKLLDVLAHRGVFALFAHDACDIGDLAQTTVLQGRELSAPLQTKQEKPFEQQMAPHELEADESMSNTIGSSLGIIDLGDDLNEAYRHQTKAKN